VDKEDSTEALTTSRSKKTPSALVQFIMHGGWIMLWIVFLIIVAAVISLWK